jgi:hypothetical protein
VYKRQRGLGDVYKRQARNRQKSKKGYLKARIYRSKKVNF